MLLAHITANTGHTLNRNTDDVGLQTVDRFKPFQMREGHLEEDIDQTPLTCRVTVNSGVAVFDILYGEKALYTNICSLKAEAVRPALSFANQTARKIHLPPIHPELPHWLCTFPVDIIGVPTDILSLYQPTTQAGIYQPSYSIAYFVDSFVLC